MLLFAYLFTCFCSFLQSLPPIISLSLLFLQRKNTWNHIICSAAFQADFHQEATNILLISEENSLTSFRPGSQGLCFNRKCTSFYLHLKKWTKKRNKKREKTKQCGNSDGCFLWINCEYEKNKSQRKRATVSTVKSSVL